VGLAVRRRLARGTRHRRHQRCSRIVRSGFNTDGGGFGKEWESERDPDGEDYDGSDFDDEGGQYDEDDQFENYNQSSLSPSTFKREDVQLDTLLPSSDEIVNADIPNHWLEVYRGRVGNNVKNGHPDQLLGRSSKGRAKINWRLKQGPELAHKNWEHPSRCTVKTGISKGRRLERPSGTSVRPTMGQVKEALFDSAVSMRLYEDRSLRMLDLFAGGGQMGIEALSRGATECIYVDSSQECVDCCLANAWMSGFMGQEEAAKGSLNQRLADQNAPIMMVGGARAKMAIEKHTAQVARSPVGAINADVFDLLEDPAKYGLIGRTFNLIHCSPDYSAVSYRKLCTALAKSELIERDAIVCIEYPRELGILPPILCAPFEDPEDAEFDDIAAGVPTLYGVRNRRFGSTYLAMYIKHPTGARGSAAEPRPWEFTESLMPNKLKRQGRHLWRTPGLFTVRDSERGFQVPKKAPRLNE